MFLQQYSLEGKVQLVTTGMYNGNHQIIKLALLSNTTCLVLIVPRNYLV